MGTVLDLRPRGSNDWTAFEKIQLESLMDCLPARAAADLAFGVTDAGDPWCAVMNVDGDVVMHVARIQGRFFVHSTVQPFVADARDLPSAVAPFVENFRRPTATVTPLFDTPVPLHAYAIFDAPPSVLEYGAERTQDAASADHDASYAAPSLPDAPDPWHAPPMLLVDDPAPLADTSQDLAPPPPQIDDSPAFLTQDDLTVSYELFFKAADPISAENAAADLAAAQPANDEAAATATPLTPLVFDPQTVADNVVIFPTPPPNFTTTTTDAATPGTSPSGLHSELADGLVRAAAGHELVANAEPGVIVAWDPSHPVDLSGVLPTAEAF
jgi:hypothetical protein